MKKNIELILLIIALIIPISAIIFSVRGLIDTYNSEKNINNIYDERTIKNDNDDNKNNTNAEKKETISLSNIESKIKNLDVSFEKIDVYYTLIGADDGLKLTSGDYFLEVYKFKTSSDKYKDAEKNQKITLNNTDMSFDAVVKNGYAYIIDDDFPKHDEIINLLEQLK